MERAIRLARPISIPAWLGLAWGVSGVLERIEFISRTAHHIREAMVNPLAGLVVMIVCATWIVLVVMWPEWKGKPIFKWLGKLSARNTLRDRVRALESSAQVVEEQAKRISQAQAQIKALESLPKAIEEQGKHISEVRERLDGNAPDLAVMKIAVFTIPDLLDLQSLIDEANQAWEDFLEIRARYGESCRVVMDAFSGDWRPISPNSGSLPEESVRDGERWAHSLEQHARHLRAWSARLGFVIVNEELERCVDGWKGKKRSMGANEVSDLLYKNYTKLLNLRSIMQQATLDGRKWKEHPPWTAYGD